MKYKFSNLSRLNKSPYYRGVTCVEKFELEKSVQEFVK